MRDRDGSLDGSLGRLEIGDFDYNGVDSTKIGRFGTWDRGEGAKQVVGGSIVVWWKPEVENLALMTSVFVLSNHDPARWGILKGI